MQKTVIDFPDIINLIYLRTLNTRKVSTLKDICKNLVDVASLIYFQINYSWWIGWGTRFSPLLNSVSASVSLQTMPFWTHKMMLDYASSEWRQKLYWKHVLIFSKKVIPDTPRIFSRTSGLYLLDCNPIQ